MDNYDFCGWATKANVRCSDGKTILKDAFKHQDGMEVPLVWGHQHDSVYDVLGKAVLEHRDNGVYVYGKFNSSDQGQTAKLLVNEGDVNALSICANKLTQQNGMVSHGTIREVSLVLAGANPEAYIENVIRHSDEFGDIIDEDTIKIFTGETFMLHGEELEEKENDKMAKEHLKHADSEKTIADIVETMTEEQQNALYAIVGSLEGYDDEDEEDEIEQSEDFEGGDYIMKHNVFETDEMYQEDTLTHADEMEIISLAKQSGVGSLKQAMAIYSEENDVLQHGFEDYEELFPEYELLKKGAPELLERDQTWIAGVMSKIHKSPISRIRTRHADARVAELKAKGYQQKGNRKTESAQINLIQRTTDPQTIYIKDSMHRDDIIDITDFDVVGYQWTLMRHILDEELALAALVGDGREEDDPDKIHETHIRSIWNDNELYTIHQDVDIAAARQELQGTDTNAHFGENYIYAEAIITAALYSRERYKGSGTPDLYCTPHLLNVMLLARDLNGRRIYDSKSDLAAALNVGEIYTVEQFEGRTRTTETGDEKKLLGLFVNLSDYQFGATKGGEVTRFEDFDMDFNKYKYMLETRLSGSLTKLYSAIALEEPVVAETPVTPGNETNAQG